MGKDWRVSGFVAAGNGAAIAERAGVAGVDAVFRDGRITLLVGANGSGKTTLLESLAGLREPAHGEIRLGGEPLWSGRRKPNRSVLLQLGIAPQHAESQWFGGTVRRELEYSMKPYRLPGGEREVRIREALGRTGLAEELLTRDPWTLSGGQQRRLALACLLACRPHWLLLDEPTAGLDAEGIGRLCAILEAHRAEGRGAVVVTHDLGALLPLADDVVVMDGGRVREAAPAAAYARSLAREAGPAAPQALRAAAELAAAGFAPPLPAGGAPWLPPRELSAELAAQLRRRRDAGGGNRPARTASPGPSGQLVAGEDAHVVDAALYGQPAAGGAAHGAGTALRGQLAANGTAHAADTALRGQPAACGAAHAADAALHGQSAASGAAHGAGTALRGQPAAGEDTNAANAAQVGSRGESANPLPAERNGGLKRQPSEDGVDARLFDPRALLAAYMLLAAGVLQQRGWAGTAVAAALTAVLLWPLRRRLLPFAGAVKAYALLIAFMTALAGIHLQPPGFDPAAAALTLLRLGKLLLVMLLGLPLLGLTTPHRLQRAIEQSLAWARPLRVPVSSVALSVALVFRFIPLLTAEWHRFARIACARGKTSTRPGSVPPSMLKAVLVPFLLSLLRLADAVADALEARGFVSRPEGLKASAGIRLRLRQRDIVLVLAAAGIYFVLIWAERI